MIGPVFIGETMAMNEALLGEFDHEMENTRRALERVPDEKFGWKPHDRSHTMGWLASHVANLAIWAQVAVTTQELDLSAPPQPGQPRPTEAKSKQELLEMFERNRTGARDAIARTSDSDMMVKWSLKNNGKTILTMPRVAVLRSFVMNHLIHHRGQLTVYFRLNDIPVPALYGPSADEGGF